MKMEPQICDVIMERNLKNGLPSDWGLPHSGELPSGTRESINRNMHESAYSALCAIHDVYSARPELRGTLGKVLKDLWSAADYARLSEVFRRNPECDTKMHEAHWMMPEEVEAQNEELRRLHETAKVEEDSPH